LVDDDNLCPGYAHVIIHLVNPEDVLRRMDDIVRDFSGEWHPAAPSETDFQISL
jgi:hypothetical protein